MLLFTGQCSKCSKNIMQLVRPCISMETHSEVEYNVPNWRTLYIVIYRDYPLSM